MELEHSPLNVFDSSPHLALYVRDFTKSFLRVRSSRDRPSLPRTVARLRIVGLVRDLSGCGRELHSVAPTARTLFDEQRVVIPLFLILHAMPCRLPAA
jgi:hypothetical protein